MKFLRIAQMGTMMRLQSSAQSGETLLEQARPFLERNPFLILDLEEIHLTSMQIGEIANLIKEFDKVWVGAEHGIALVNVPEASRKVLQAVHLNRHLPCFETASQALRHFAERGDEAAQSHSGS